MKIKKFLFALLLILSSLLIACAKTSPPTTSSTDSKDSPVTSEPVTTTNQVIGEKPNTSAPEADMNTTFKTETLYIGTPRTFQFSADEALSFKTTNNGAEVGEVRYSAAEKLCEVDIAAKIPGSCDLLVIAADGSFRVLPLEIPMPPRPGEEISCMEGAIGRGSAVNSPGGEGPSMAFDGDVTTKWLTKSKTGFLDVRFTDGGHVVKVYTITSANDDDVRDPKAWTFSGSNDGENWTVLDRRSGESFNSRHLTKRYEIDNDTAFTHYRLEITENNGADFLQLSELALYEIGGEDLVDYSGMAPTPYAGLTLSAGREVLFEGESLEITADGVGDVRFVLPDAALSLLSSDGSRLTVKAVGTSLDSRVVALDSEGNVGVYPLSCVGEGSYIYITDTIDAEFGADADTEALDPSPAFDRKRDSYLSALCDELTLTVSFLGNRRVLVNSYALLSSDDRALAPSDWVFEGSLDGKTWVKLDERSGEVFEGNNLRRIFDTDNTTPYAFYRIRLSGDSSSSGLRELSIAEFQLIQAGAYPDSWALGPFVKLDSMNPILTPNNSDWFLDPITDEPVYWSEEALYNPTAVVKDDVVCLLYRSQDHPLTSRVGLALSLDGTHFENYKEPVLFPDDEDPFYDAEFGGGCEDPRIVRDENGVYYMYYTAYSHKNGIAKLYVATSTDLKTWTKHGNAFSQAYGGKYTGMWAKSAAVICDMVGDQFIARRMDDGKYWFYFGEGRLYAAWSDDLINWTPLEDENGNLVVVMEGREGKFDSRLVECGPQAIYTEYGVLLIYNGANASPAGDGDPMLVYNAYCPGMVLFDPDDHLSVKERTETFFMYPEKHYELDGLVNNVCFVEGLVFYHGSWYLYYGTADSRLAVAVYTPEPRDDSRLNAAIAAAEEVEAPTEELADALRVAKEAALSALYKQEWVDEIAERLNSLL